MIIVHENMEIEAESVSEVLKQVFGLESKLVAADLSDVFVPMPGFDAYATSDFRVVEYLRAMEQKGPKESAMYEIVDIKAPKPEDGYLQLGAGTELEKRFDAGLDNVIARLNNNWFCDPCKAGIKIHEN